MGRGRKRRVDGRRTVHQGRVTVRRGLSARPELRPPSTVKQALGRLRSADRRKRQALASWDRTLTACATEARALGASWTEIGDVLGVSKQGAWRRFGVATAFVAEPADPRECDETGVV